MIHRSRRMVAGATAVLVLAGLSGACTALSSGAANPGRSTAPPSEAAPTTPAASTTKGDNVVTPLVAGVLATPVPALATDGKVHLAYELMLSNAVSSEVTVDRLAVMDGETPVLTLEGGNLAAATRATGGDLGARTLASGQGAMIFLDVVFDSYSAVPSTLEHALTVTLATPSLPNLPRAMTETVARMSPLDAKPVVVGPPLAGDRWVNANGCCLVTTHRLVTTPVNGAHWASERYAIDFLRLDGADKQFDGPIDQLSSYEYYGADVLAVADGPIIAMVSDEREWTPGTLPTGLKFAQFGGNYLVQDLGNGQYAFYAHLQPGNPKGVAVGDQVKRGQVIGLLGNSGNSDSPHLHFHVMRGPDPLVSDGLPFVIDSMQYEGKVPSMAVLGDAAAGKPVTIDKAGAVERRDQSPLVLDVMGFPGTGASR